MNAGSARILLEVCVGSVADIKAALAAGADRVELCGALELGGLTPSLGLVENALATSSAPIVVMLRPRAGGFCYDHDEFDAMLRDARRFLELGASGLAFGILDQHGNIDMTRSREIIQRAGERQTVFHRAFDFVPDQRAASDALIEIGCTRVLTSGGQPTAAQGAAVIRELVAHADGRIEVLAGGGICAENVLEIVHISGCAQVHVGASAIRNDKSIGPAPNIDLCDERFLHGAAHRGVAGEAVAATIAALRSVDLHA